MTASNDQARHFIGDVGEIALRIALETDGHQVVQAADRHASRPDRQHSVDLVTRFGVDFIHEVKTFGSQRQGAVYAARLNYEGVPSLTKPLLSRTKDGIRQGSSEYIAARLGEVIITSENPAPGMGHQVLVHKIDLRVMKYQSWRVESTGKIGDPTGRPKDCLDEVTTAMLALAEQDGMGLEQ
ncbi:hypothetical protein [Streptomyces sp. V4I2]|uniref:hypothetical protein n=1 Tax=Streptomyces sp. V4I2 TaxID=3042280 RepID=UPI0027D92ABF|nr:hypothetical protein [Streptomyces sp. V4I2]